MRKDWPEILSFAQEITMEVGTQLLQDFGRVSAQEKADGSLVTQADQWADQTLSQAIAATFPDHGVLSEEADHVFPGTEWCWIIDPLDGTTNFTQGVPVWGISLGLLYQGTPVFGYVHLPPLGQTFYGFWQAPDHGNGAWLNGEAIHSSPAPPDPNQFFSLCSRSVDLITQPFPCKIRMLGAASYNFLMVAAGITLGGVEATPKIWDIAAVWPIGLAAGATWVALEPDPVFPLQEGSIMAIALFRRWWSVSRNGCQPLNPWWSLFVARSFAQQQRILEQFPNFLDRDPNYCNSPNN